MSFNLGGTQNPTVTREDVREDWGLLDESEFEREMRQPFDNGYVLLEDNVRGHGVTLPSVSYTEATESVDLGRDDELYGSRYFARDDAFVMGDTRAELVDVRQSVDRRLPETRVEQFGFALKGDYDSVVKVTSPYAKEAALG